jgi:hypothetical protein
MLSENPQQSSEERAPSPTPVTNAEREVFIATELKKSQERVNRDFKKYLHAKTTEQASASILGAISSDDQHMPLNIGDNAMASYDYDPYFEEIVSHFDLMKLTLCSCQIFLFDFCSSGCLDIPEGVQFIFDPFSNKKYSINNAEKDKLPNPQPMQQTNQMFLLHRPQCLSCCHLQPSTPRWSSDGNEYISEPAHALSSTLPGLPIILFSGAGDSLK